MPADFKDYYTTLGVPREATADEIKKAFRKLARKHHPDLAEDKKAGEARFKEINEAHEVLSDPEKRKRYDELGAQWQNGGSAPNGTSRTRTHTAGAEDGREFHFTGTGFSDFFEQYFGGAQSFGFDPDGPASESRRSAPGRPGSDVEGEILVTLDEVMRGTVRPISLKHVDPRTGDAGTESFQVRIPAGAPEGRRIRVAGKGGPGRGNAPAGDLYLRVRYEAHPDFRVKGSDLFHDAALSPWEAVLGTNIVVPSFEGPIKVRVPPHTQHGALLRVPGHGLPKGRSGHRGDLYVVPMIQLPEHISDEEKHLWEELRKASRFNPRQHA